MVRTPIGLPLNRSFLVLLVLLSALAAVAAGRAVVGGSLQSAAPVFAPVEDPEPIAPAVDIPSAPLPATETAAPAPASVLPATQPAAPAVTALPAATAVPHATLRAGPPLVPGRDIHSIAPEPGMPGFDPPPGRD